LFNDRGAENLKKGGRATEPPQGNALPGKKDVFTLPRTREQGGNLSDVRKSEGADATQGRGKEERV